MIPSQMGSITSTCTTTISAVQKHFQNSVGKVIKASAPTKKENITFSSGMNHTYGEYDKNGKMIRTFTYQSKRYAYRVMKYKYDIF